MSTGMDWTKHATTKVAKAITGPKRIPVTVSPELQKLIEHFKASFPEAEFSTTAVLHTLLEAGARAYAVDVVAKRAAKHLTQQTPAGPRDVPSSDDEVADHPDV